jgi:hypothetical protein
MTQRLPGISDADATGVAKDTLELLGRGRCGGSIRGSTDLHPDEPRRPKRKNGRLGPSV